MSEKAGHSTSKVPDLTLAVVKDFPTTEPSSLDFDISNENKMGQILTSLTSITSSITILNKGYPNSEATLTGLRIRFSRKFMIYPKLS